MASNFIKLPSAVFDIIDDTVTSPSKTWSSQKIQLELDALGEIYVRSTRFETISSGTSGSVTLTGSQQIILDDFGGTTDAVVASIEGGRPTNFPAEDASGNIIAATMDASGNWTLVGTPESYPVAIIYRVREYFNEYNDLDSAVIGGLQLQILNRTVEDTVPASSSKVIEVQPLSDFNRVKYEMNIEGGGTSRNFTSHVTNNSGTLEDQLFGRSAGLDFQYNINTNSGNMEITIVNNEVFDLDVKFTRLVF